MTQGPSAVQTLTIRDWLPEQIANGSRGHWSKHQKKLNAAQVMTWSAARQANWQPVQGRSRLTIVFVFPVRRVRDVDNLNSRAKGAIDGLKTHTIKVGRGKAAAVVTRAGWIVDDSTDWLDLIVRAEVRPGVRQTELTLEAL